MRDLLASGVELDGVIVSTPHATHFEVGVELLARPGLHILMEKPFTTDVDQVSAGIVFWCVCVCVVVMVASWDDECSNLARCVVLMRCAVYQARALATAVAADAADATTPARLLLVSTHARANPKGCLVEN